MALPNERVCILCEKTIISRQIMVKLTASGKSRARCPTEGWRSRRTNGFILVIDLPQTKRWRDSERAFEEHNPEPGNGHNTQLNL